MLATIKTLTKEITVLRANVSFPITGAFHASLVLDTAEPADLTGLATLELSTEGVTRSLQGSLLLGVAFSGKSSVKFLAGNGGLTSVLPAKYYKDTEIRLIALDTLSAAKETLDPISELADFINHYAREEGSCSKAILDFARAFSKDWFVRDSGLIFFGTRPQAEYEGEFQVLEEDGPHQSKEIALVTPDLSPAQTLDSQLVTRVDYLITPDKTRVFIRVSK